jgi:hypothetical protein
MYDFIFFTDVTDTLLVYKPIGAYKCAHILREQGYSVLVVDHLHTFTREEFRNLLDLTITNQTKFVGFSSTFFKKTNQVVPDSPTKFEFMQTIDEHFFPQGVEFEKEMINHIKEINPDCAVVLGGTLAHPNLQNKLIDYTILGFGEQSIINLARHLEVGEPLKNARRNLWGVTVIDDKLAQGYDFQNSTFCWESTDILNSQVLPLEISRGCIFKCAFCSYPMIGKKANDYIRTSDILAEEMQNNYDRFGISTYYVIDDTFNDNEYKLDTLLEAVKKLTFKPVFWAYTRLDLLTTRKHVDKLYEIGLRGMYFGIETLNPKTGRAINKGHNRELQIETIKHIREKYGNEISMHGSFIVGLPYEDIESVTDTYQRLRSGEIPLHTYRFTGLSLRRADNTTWSSELSRDYEKFGYTVLSEEHDDPYGMQWTNEFMDRHQSIELANQWNEESQKSTNYYIPNQVSWALINYGYDLDYLHKTKFHEVDWSYMERTKKVEFMDNYKQKLFDYLEQNTV